jgi:hypothetical protein
MQKYGAAEFFAVLTTSINSAYFIKIQNQPVQAINETYRTKDDGKRS